MDFHCLGLLHNFMDSKLHQSTESFACIIAKTIVSGMIVVLQE